MAARGFSLAAFYCECGNSELVYDPILISAVGGDAVGTGNGITGDARKTLRQHKRAARVIAEIIVIDLFTLRMKRYRGFQFWREKPCEIAQRMSFRLAFGILPAEARRTTRIYAHFAFKQATFRKACVVVVI